MIVLTKQKKKGFNPNQICAIREIFFFGNLRIYGILWKNINFPKRIYWKYSEYMCNFKNLKIVFNCNLE